MKGLGPKRNLPPIQPKKKSEPPMKAAVDLSAVRQLATPSPLPVEKKTYRLSPLTILDTLSERFFSAKEQDQNRMAVLRAIPSLNAICSTPRNEDTLAQEVEESKTAVDTLFKQITHSLSAADAKNQNTIRGKMIGFLNVLESIRLETDIDLLPPVYAIPLLPVVQRRERFVIEGHPHVSGEKAVVKINGSTYVATNVSLKNEEQLGRKGSFGRTRTVYCVEDKKEYANKKVKVRFYADLFDLYRECSIANTLADSGAKHILPIKEAFLYADGKKRNAAVIMERCSSFSDAVTRTAKSNDFKSLFSLMRGMGEGILEMHRLGFFHNDITLRNAMIRENGTPVLIDFGLAMRIDQLPEWRAVGLGRGQIGGTNPDPDCVKFRARKATADELDGRKIDVFAFAVSLLEAVGTPADYKGDGVSNFVGGVRTALTTWPPQWMLLADLIYHCITSRQTNRYTMEDVMTDPFWNQFSGP